MYKENIRAAMLKKRLALSQAEVQAASGSVVNSLLRLPLFQQSKKMAAYIPFKNEIDLSSFFEKAWALEKEIYLPCVGDGPLSFRKYTQDSIVKKSSWGVLEPVDGELIEPFELDLVLVPLLAFDKSGNRIGFGAGHYDRTFANHPATLRLIGVGYDWQCIDQVPEDGWDVRLLEVVSSV